MDNPQAGKRPNLIIRIWDWMDGRFQIGKLVQTLLHVYVPKDAKTYYLGGTTLFLFLIQGVTGSLLALYYKATPDTAYDSVLFITSSVNFGWLIRSIHHWGANLMIIFCVLHLLRIFVQGAYKPPREMTWIIGVVLLLLTLLFGFTGYLLPWDERAYWATTVGSEFAGSVPLIGDFLLQFLRGGVDVSEATLSRFYGAHTLFLPEILAVFLLIHIVLMHQQGLANPKKPAKIPSSPQPDGEKEKTIPFFPNYLLGEVVAWLVVIGLIVILASIFPVGIEENANPLETPADIKPEWYFLSFYQLLKWIPETLGVIIPAVGLPLLLLLPFLDRSPEVKPSKRKLVLIIGLAVLLAIIVLTILGWQS